MNTRSQNSSSKNSPLVETATSSKTSSPLLLTALDKSKKKASSQKAVQYRKKKHSEKSKAALELGVANSDQELSTYATTSAASIEQTQSDPCTLVSTVSTQSVEEIFSYMMDQMKKSNMT